MQLQEVQSGMKIINYVLIFVFFIAAALIRTNYQQSSEDKMTSERIAYNHSVDSALDTAVDNLVEVADGSDLKIDLQKCVNSFYREMYASFGVSDSEAGQKRLNSYIPCMAIADNDGLYVLYNDLENNKLIQRWTTRIPYCYNGIAQVDGITSYGYTVLFQMDDTVKLVIDGGRNVYYGDRDGLKEKYQGDSLLRSVYDNSILAKDGDYHNWKSYCVTSTVVDTLSTYLERYNTIAAQCGVSFQFKLPETVRDDVQRNVSDITFMAVFQGYPYAYKTRDTYSRFAISGTRIRKGEGYYANMMVTDGDAAVIGDESRTQMVYTYHRPSCSKINGRSYYYKTREEAALAGAFPCPYCHP